MPALTANICLFLSGFAGLVYQLCWIREATLVFGSTVYGVTTVIAVFFLGLAVGAEAGGRVARVRTDPLRLFATLEISLGIVALLVPYGFDLSHEVLAAHYASLAGRPVWLGLARAALLALVLLPPTIIMGATLPLFVRQFSVSAHTIGRSVGSLYAVNTLGAACGCAVAGFVLVPTLGLTRAIQIAAALNIGIGFVVASLPLARLAPVVHSRIKAAESPPLIVAVLVFVTGFVALGNEVLWTRYLSLLIHTSVITYTIALTVVLLGIVIGSLWASRIADGLRDRARLFGVLQVLLALSTVGVIHLPPGVLAWLGDGAATYALVLLFPAVVSGASLLLAVRMAVDKPDEASVVTGRLFAANTAGAILGSVIIGFVALPLVGLTGSLWLTSGASMAAGIAAWWQGTSPVRYRRRLFSTLVAVACWLLLPQTLGTRVPEDFLSGRGTLVDFREGVSANMAIVRERGVLQLEIDRWWQGSNRKNHQVLAAHLPMLLHPSPRSVLVVGAGTGQTARRFLMYDIEQLHVVDIEPQIFDFIGPYFGEDWMRDTRTTLIRDDARNYITLTPRRYDLISLEVGQVFRPGAASFYTEDFYRTARARLESGGLLAQFLPMPFFTPAEFLMVLGTFQAVFPNSVLWYNTSELLLIGVNAEKFSVDADRVELVGQHGEIATDLEFSHWGGSKHHLNQADVLLAGFLAGPDALAQMAGAAPLYRDDRPFLEYSTSYSFSEARASEIPIVRHIRNHLQPVDEVLQLGIDNARLASIERTRQLNLADIIASARIRQAGIQQGPGALQATTNLLREALQHNPHSVLALRLLGEARIQAGDIEEAAQLFRRAETLRPRDLHVRRGLGYLLHQQGRLEEAISYYRLVLKEWSVDADTHNYLGAALAASGEMDAARQHFEQALQLRPGYEDAARNLQRLQVSTQR